VGCTSDACINKYPVWHLQAARSNLESTSSSLCARMHPGWSGSTPTQLCDAACCWTSHSSVRAMLPVVAVVLVSCNQQSQSELASHPGSHCSQSSRGWTSSQAPACEARQVSQHCTLILTGACLCTCRPPGCPQTCRAGRYIQPGSPSWDRPLHRRGTWQQARSRRDALLAQTSRLKRARTAERRDNRAVHFDGRRLLSKLHRALGVARHVAVRLHTQAVRASARSHSGRLKQGAQAPAFQTSRTCIHFEVCDSRPSPSPRPLVERRSPRWACPGVTVMVCASISSGDTATSDALATLVRSLPAPRKRSTVSYCSHTGGCRRCWPAEGPAHAPTSTDVCRQADAPGPAAKHRLLVQLAS